jgi:hypothetical protein
LLLTLVPTKSTNKHVNQLHDDGVTVWRSHWHQRPRNSNGRTIATTSPVPVVAVDAVATMAVAADAAVTVGALAAKAATRACSRQFIVVILEFTAARAPAMNKYSNLYYLLTGHVHPK